MKTGYLVKSVDKNVREFKNLIIFLDLEVAKEYVQQLEAEHRIKVEKSRISYQRWAFDQTTLYPEIVDDLDFFIEPIDINERME